jgi:alanyl-tRNA synthetase
MLESRVDQLTQELTTLRRQIAQFQREAAQRQTQTLAEKALDVSGVPVVAAKVDVPDDRVLREMGELVLSNLSQPGVVALASNYPERVGIQVSISPELTRRGLHAGKIAGAVGQRLGGKGGGRPESAQGGGKNKAELGAALALVPELVKQNIG